MDFVKLEKNIFNAVCLAAQNITSQILNEMDEHILKTRPKEYRLKAIKETTVKTVYGDVRYKRRMYIDKSGHARYLLDEAMKTKQVGMYSENLIQKIVNAATEESYRNAAEQINETTGNNLSHCAVWGLVNKIGSTISEQENIVSSDEYNPDKRDVNLLFEEMDGVWLPIQAKDHKKDKKHELKVATIYEGWDAETGKKLINRKIVAGMEPAKTFIKKKDNVIRNTYNIDEIQYRVLNGDGGNWIKDDAEGTIFQLDRFHVLKEIREKIRDKKAIHDITSLYLKCNVDEMLDYIKIYADSIDTNDETDNWADKARRLFDYLNNNYDGLIPYNKRNIDLPEAPEGVQYKSMGVQENQNCTVITLRMKHGRMRWSLNGANAMAKVLAAKKNGVLNHYINHSVITGVAEPIAEVLSAAKIPVRIGDTNYYPDLVNKTLPMLHGSLTEGIRTIKNMCIG